MGNGNGNGNGNGGRLHFSIQKQLELRAYLFSSFCFTFISSSCSSVLVPDTLSRENGASNTIVRFCHGRGRWGGRLDDERQVAHAGV